MKPIVFRGKQTGTGEWIYGYPVELSGHIYLYYCVYDAFLSRDEVIPETLCACTGQLGEGDTPLYEHDIVFDTMSSEFGVVEWAENDAMFVVRYQDYFEAFDVIDSRDLRVLGNIFDDSSLLDQ